MKTKFMIMDLNKFDFIITEDIYISLNSRKDCVTRYIYKNFIENVDYIKYKKHLDNKTGGRPKFEYRLTQTSYQLLINSYKLRQIELGNKSITHPILIYAETAILGFIFEVFKEYKMVKQYKIGKYFIDLFFIEYNLAIEIDELHHELEVNKKLDIEREEYLILSLNCTIYRYKPHKDNLYDIIHDIMNFVSQPKKIFTL